MTAPESGDQPPSHGAGTSGFGLQSAAPVLLFVVANRIAGLRLAVAAATACSLLVVIDRRRRGVPLGRFMPIITVAVLLRGLIGVITGSETVYFGLGIASKYLVAAVLLASVVIRKPLARLAAPYVLDLEAQFLRHRQFHRAMATITVIAAIYYAISASFDIWLFQRSSVEGFVILRFFANWPLSAAAILAILIAVQVQLAKIPGIGPIPALFERKMASYGR